MPGGITRDAAKQIARDACAPSLDSIQVYDAPQPGWCLYLTNMDEPCWFVTVPSGVPHLMKSSAVEVISSKTGRVVLCGSAFDEG